MGIWTKVAANRRGSRLRSVSRSRWRGILILTSVASAAALAFWYFVIHTPPVPRRTLRIGFEQVPPMQIRTESGFAGLSVETVQEAAKRGGVSLQWVETGTSTDEALQRGLVDLWPAMIDLPERRKRVHITRPWMHTSHSLVLRAEMEAPGSNFAGRIAFFKVPVDVRLARVEFPGAQLVEYADMREIVRQSVQVQSPRVFWRVERLWPQYGRSRTNVPLRNCDSIPFVT